MPTLDASQIALLLQPYVGDFLVPGDLYPQLAKYLELLLKWNARTNLTSIREPEEIVRRHFGESLFAGICLAKRVEKFETLLDFGSGAGFPGLPIQLLLPDIHVTLAESQNKKATFLREAVRTLGLQTTVHGARVELLPASTVYEVVTLRAVDNMEAALTAARPRVAGNGWLAVLTSEALAGAESYPLPNAQRTALWLQQL